MTDSIAEKLALAVKVFEKDVGTWDAEVEVRPAPGAEVVRQKGVSINRIVGDRWLVVDYHAEGGFEGHGIYGWDSSTGRYTGAWVDSMQTSIARSVGSWDPERRTMTFETETKHGDRVIRYREITETLADGSQVYRNVFATPDGEHEMIRTIYRRKSG